MIYFVCGKTAGNTVSGETVLAMTTSYTVAQEMARANGPDAYYTEWDDLTESQKTAAKYMLTAAASLYRKVNKKQ
jgi:hypothetical protein